MTRRQPELWANAAARLFVGLMRSTGMSVHSWADTLSVPDSQGTLPRWLKHWRAPITLGHYRIANPNLELSPQAKGKGDMASAFSVKYVVVVLVGLSLVFGGLLTSGSVAHIHSGPNGPQRIYLRYSRQLFGFHSVINVDSEPQARPIPTFRLFMAF